MVTTNIIKTPYQAAKPYRIDNIGSTSLTYFYEVFFALRAKISLARSRMARSLGVEISFKIIYENTPTYFRGYKPIAIYLLPIDLDIKPILIDIVAIAPNKRVQLTVFNKTQTYKTMIARINELRVLNNVDIGKPLVFVSMDDMNNIKSGRRSLKWLDSRVRRALTELKENL